MYRVETTHGPVFDAAAHGENVSLSPDGSAATCGFGGGVGTFAMVAGDPLTEGATTLFMRLAKVRTSAAAGTARAWH